MVPIGVVMLTLERSSVIVHGQVLDSEQGYISRDYIYPLAVKAFAANVHDL